MSSFGKIFKITTFGESHCPGVGCVVEGVPPRMRLSSSDIQTQLNRRRPGQSSISTPRDESDAVEILSGIENGYTLGTPIALLVKNKDQRPHDYKQGASTDADIPRPSHADYTYTMKYGINASSGGGRASARETIARVASGAIAEKWLLEKYTTDIIAFVSSVGPISIDSSQYNEQFMSNLTRDVVDSNIIRCPVPSVAEEMHSLISKVKEDNDSIGGIITCIVRNCPVGLGEPCFDKLEAVLAHAMLSIPATKGFSYGSGFEGTMMRGSEHNDAFTTKHTTTPIGVPNIFPTALTTTTNYSGGVQGGISNGNFILFHVAFKPVATISQPQSTLNFDGTKIQLENRGRHDPCVVPRAVAIVEAMTALCIADLAMIQESRIQTSTIYDFIGRVKK